jgi:N-acetylmuramic acid 6-phosphate etherase
VRPVRPDLDALSAVDVVAAVLAAEQRVLPAVQAATPAIAAAADLVAARWTQGGRLVFVGAGTSGRIATQEAAELPGTFGLERTRVRACVAGGADSTDGDEDDRDQAARDAAELDLSADDVVVAVAASGSTPYTLDFATAAVAAGAAVVAVVTVTGSPLAAIATVAVEAVVGAEVLRDSTRLGAGTAQKLALDALTVAAAARLGRVHGDLMVDVVSANTKLRARAAGIVAEIADCDRAAATAALDECGGNTRAAVVRIVLGLEPAAAIARAAAYRTLRDAVTAP